MVPPGPLSLRPVQTPPLLPPPPAHANIGRRGVCQLSPRPANRALIRVRTDLHLRPHSPPFHGAPVALVRQPRCGNRPRSHRWRLVVFGHLIPFLFEGGTIRYEHPASLRCCRKTSHQCIATPSNSRAPTLPTPRSEPALTCAFLSLSPDLLHANRLDCCFGSYRLCLLHAATVYDYCPTWRPRSRSVDNLCDSAPCGFAGIPSDHRATPPMNHRGLADYGSTESTPTQFDKIAKDLMSEGLSIGKALAEQGKGYYEEMKVRANCVLLRPVPRRCVGGLQAGCRSYFTEAHVVALPCAHRVGIVPA